jgi:predicted nuclease of restriction endonuclease-like (RecB) superfamily
VGYQDFLHSLKLRIRQTQIQAARAASQSLLELYFSIGRDLIFRQEREGWGSAVIERLARDLRRELPGQHGFSASNLWRMRAFYLTYRPTLEVLAQPVRELMPPSDDRLPSEVALLPWGHHVILMERAKDPAQRAFYAQAALENGWSRDVLQLQIRGKLYERQSVTKKLTNFQTHLPKPLSDLAEQTLKDPYLFDFLTIGEEAHECDIEKALVQHITKFLLELGTGFSFVGRQVHLEVGGEDFYIDLLFYHLKLRAFVVVELKAGAFKPEHAGQLNFYLSAVDAKLRHATDNPSIGLILCRDKNRTVAEYALGGMSKPMGIAEWQRTLTTSLPDDLRSSLPTVQELEQELAQLDETTSPAERR